MLSSRLQNTSLSRVSCRGTVTTEVGTPPASCCIVQRERLEPHAAEVAGRHARFKAGTAAVLKPAIRKPRAAATTVTQTVALSLHRIGAMSITVFKPASAKQKVVNGNLGCLLCSAMVALLCRILLLVSLLAAAKAFISPAAASARTLSLPSTATSLARCGHKLKLRSLLTCLQVF
jgi:hypothetical protein